MYREGQDLWHLCYSQLANMVISFFTSWWLWLLGNRAAGAPWRASEGAGVCSSSYHCTLPSSKASNTWWQEPAKSPEDNLNPLFLHCLTQCHKWTAYKASVKARSAWNLGIQTCTRELLQSSSDHETEHHHRKKQFTILVKGGLRSTLGNVKDFFRVPWTLQLT